MTSTKSQAVFFLGVLTALTGASSLLVTFLPHPWPHLLVVLGLLLVNAGLFWLGQCTTCG